MKGYADFRVHVNLNPKEGIQWDSSNICLVALWTIPDVQE